MTSRWSSMKPSSASSDVYVARCRDVSCGSAPGAGSDLAGLRARPCATATSGSSRPEGLDLRRPARRLRHAARPHRPGRPQAPGHHFFVIDDAPARLEVRPLRQMTGHASFNEVFLDDARVPDDDHHRWPHTAGRVGIRRWPRAGRAARRRWRGPVGCPAPRCGMPRGRGRAHFGAHVRVPPKRRRPRLRPLGAGRRDSRAAPRIPSSASSWPSCRPREISPLAAALAPARTGRRPPARPRGLDRQVGGLPGWPGTARDPDSQLARRPRSCSGRARSRSTASRPGARPVRAGAVDRRGQRRDPAQHHRRAGPRPAPEPSDHRTSPSRTSGSARNVTDGGACSGPGRDRTCDRRIMSPPL